MHVDSAIAGLGYVFPPRGARVRTETFSTVPELFLRRVSVSGDALAYRYPSGSGWAELTWAQAAERVRAIASGLSSLGLGSEDRVAILSGTRVEWILCDLGVLCAGAATTTIYPSNTPEECAFIVTDSGTRLVFAEDDGQVEKLVSVRDQLPTVERVVTLDGRPSADGWVITLAELERLGAAHAEAEPDAFDTRVASIRGDHLATLIYTSGTTGRPKGVELTHDCWVYEAWGMAEIGMLTEEDHQYLWLPLSHSFGKVLEVGQIQCGFATTVDGRIPKLVENLAVVRPTVMAAAPRIFEKVYNKVVTGAQDAGGAKLKIFTWAVGVGREVSGLRQAGKEPRGLTRLKYRIADQLVFSKLRALFGGRIRFFISGSAPLSLEMAEFFHAAGVLILEGYGLTESSAASFVNRPDAFRFGTVGQPLAGTEVKLAPEDGEILMRGRGIMRGYWGLEEVTAQTLDGDGWLHTGDIGVLDDDGFLKITDRKKNLIKTSGGKYVAPQKLEGRLKALCPYLSQVLVHGDRRNFCTALVTLDPEAIGAWAADRGMEGAGAEALAQSDEVQAMVSDAVDTLNADLARYETIKRFAVLPHDFTVEEGLLTPSLKVKRKAVEERYGDVLNGFYTGALAAV